MITVELNPRGIRADYLVGLNACFPSWGGDEKFQWALARAFDEQLPDLLVVREEGKAVAGSGVSYRNICVGDARPLRVGIMTGSWTLPEARRRGHFERLIEASRTRTAERGAVLLLAFVTAENPSYRRLAAAGAAQWATHYFSSANERAEVRHSNPVRLTRVSDETNEIYRILERVGAARDRTARFVYTADEWVAQFLKRPNETEWLRLNEDGATVLETQDGIDRILALYVPTDAGFLEVLQTLTADAVGRGHRLMFFTTSPEQAIYAETFGMKRLPGYLMALPVHPQNAQTAAIEKWAVQSGDRM
jgi:ribosomal protein S18 acetylase RimI-like enzyme